MNKLDNFVTESNTVLQMTERMVQAFSGAGIGFKDAAKVIYGAISKAEIDSHEEILLIHSNPSLSRFQKWRLTCRILSNARKKGASTF